MQEFTRGHRSEAGINEEVINILGQIIEALRFKEYFDSLYGQGLKIANWHMNGDLEPFDNFYDSALEG